MLSQKTALIAKLYYETKKTKLKNHLTDLYTTMMQDHSEIINNHLNSEKSASIYYHAPYNLNREINNYLYLISRFLEQEDKETLNKIEASSFSLLPKINTAVYIFEKESNEKTSKLMAREFLILIGTLLTLIFEAVFIVIPAIKISSRKDSELHRLIDERTHELEELSITDQLTSLYNRRKIDKILHSEIEQAKRYHHSFSLILIDIDYFKKVNDTYGHQTGDDVLQDISLLFLSHIRKSDLVGRWGGEEFLIISLEKDSEKVFQFAEKLRLLIESHSFKKTGQLTCSFGIAHFQQEDTLESLLERTDNALYGAKAAGRNCVIAR